MLLAVSGATEGLIHEIQQWEEVVGIQPACLNRSPVSAVPVLVGGLRKDKGTPADKSTAGKESSVKCQLPISISLGRLVLSQRGARVMLYACFGRITHYMLGGVFSATNVICAWVSTETEPPCNISAHLQFCSMQHIP